MGSWGKTEKPAGVCLEFHVPGCSATRLRSTRCVGVPCRPRSLLGEPEPRTALGLWTLGGFGRRKLAENTSGHVVTVNSRTVTVTIRHLLEIFFESCFESWRGRDLQTCVDLEGSLCLSVLPSEESEAMALLSPFRSWPGHANPGCS